MSADNYERVNKHPNGGYFIDTVFASDENWPTPEETLAWWRENGGREPKIYATLEEATAAAHEEYSEYGVIYSFPIRVVEE